jgi:ferritin-like metal-binding protein YciE
MPHTVCEYHKPEHPMSLDTLHDLMVSELKDLYSAETQLVKALPKMAKAAGSESLRTAFTEHLEQTKGQILRLDEIFALIDASPRGKKCKAMEGLVEEGSEMAAEKGEDAVRDAGLIAAAQRVEHYEIAAYGSTIAYARLMGHDAVVELLEATLDEEKAADSRLTALAESEVNPAANLFGMDEEEGEDEPEDDGAEADDDAPAARRTLTTGSAAAKKSGTSTRAPARQSRR